MSGSSNIIEPDNLKDERLEKAIEDLSITPVILAGGEGRRLRPLTSDQRPKPFLHVAKDYSLFQETLLRCAPFGAPVVVGHERHNLRFLKECQDLRLKPAMIIGEPVARGTAASIALAAMGCSYLGHKVMVVMPSDHYIENIVVFQHAIRQAVQNLKSHDVCIIGVTPRDSKCRYGYIQTQQQENEEKVRSFIEKPDKQMAEALIKAGSCFWNTGIFAVQPQRYLSLLQLHEPDIYNAVQHAYEGRVFEEKGAFDRFSVDYDALIQAPPIVVDRAIMEKTRNAAFVSLETCWDDLGCWRSFLKMLWLRRLGLIASPQYQL